MTELSLLFRPLFRTVVADGCDERKRCREVQWLDTRVGKYGSVQRVCVDGRMESTVNGD